jgi:dihydroorotase
MAHQYDWLIKGGRVVDPDMGIDGIYDVAIQGKRIAAVEPAIAASTAANVYDASGRIVAAGLIDIHTHIGWGHSHSLDPDLLAHLGGATTNVDAGTVGRLWHRGWKRFVHEACHSRALVFLSANSFGMLWHDHFDNAIIDPEVTGEFVRENRDTIVGVKLRLMEDDNRPSTRAVAERVRETAAIGEVPVMFHLSPGHKAQYLIIPDMRPGDIITHCFNLGCHLLVNGKIHGVELRREAQQRGVVLDVGHGQAGFDFGVAAAYLEAGVLPDVISTDLHGGCIWRRAFDMPTVMSKFLYLGMSLSKVLECSNINAAKAIGLDHEIGSLRPGKIADVAILELQEGRFPMVDGRERNRVIAKERLRAIKTFCSGEPLVVEGEAERSHATWLPKGKGKTAWQSN